jgi:succinylglutamic semialdehyde dehydrogenase
VLPFEQKEKIFHSFVKSVESDKLRISQLISEESGKPNWEALQEVNSLIGKMEVSIKAYKERCSESINDVSGKKSYTRFKPHGVMAVIGPYNFPLTMANGHIMPSLVAGNTIVFKPSELTPLCGLVIAQHWQKAGLPQGVLNCISGNGKVGEKLSEHKDINGVLFVGSHSVGLSILRANRDRPERIIALEMGGNSPLMIEDFDTNKTKEVLELIIQSSFITSGQRCSSARRLLVNRNYDPIIADLALAIQKLKIGHFSSQPEPFMGQ